METDTPIVRRYLTLNETAEYLRISRSHLNRLMKDGTLIAHRLGGRVLFDIEELDAAVRNRCSAQAPDQHAA